MSAPIVIGTGGPPPTSPFKSFLKVVIGLALVVITAIYLNLKGIISLPTAISKLIPEKYLPPAAADAVADDAAATNTADAVADEAVATGTVESYEEEYAHYEEPPPALSFEETSYENDENAPIPYY